MLQASELAFGIGCILAPVIMKPFLVGEVGSTSFKDVSNYHLTSDHYDHGRQISAEERKYRLMWPTLITGACMMPNQYTILSSSFYDNMLVNNQIHRGQEHLLN